MYYVLLLLIHYRDLLNLLIEDLEFLD